MRYQPSTRTKRRILKGRETMTGGQHHHAHAEQGGGDDEVDDEEGDEHDEAHLEGCLQFADGEGGNEDVGGDVVRAVRLGAAGELEEEGEVLLAGLLEHELAKGGFAALEGLLLGDGAGEVGLDRLVVDGLDLGGHDEGGEEEGHPDENLVRRQLGDADGVPDEGEDDDDAGEGGDHHEDGGGEGEDGDEDEELDRGGDVAGVLGERCRVLRRGRLTGGGRLLDAAGEEDEREAEEGEGEEDAPSAAGFLAVRHAGPRWERVRPAYRRRGAGLNPENPTGAGAVPSRAAGSNPDPGPGKRLSLAARLGADDGLAGGALFAPAERFEQLGGEVAEGGGGRSSRRRRRGRARPLRG
nr:hypothetical protein [Tepidiforma sp.]